MVYDIAGGHDMVYGIAWRVMAWYMVLPGELWHGILYGLAGMAWYMIRSGEVWHGMCKCLCEFIALGYGPVHMWRSRCQLEVLFTRTGPIHK